MPEMNVGWLKYLSKINHTNLTPPLHECLSPPGNLFCTTT